MLRSPVCRSALLVLAALAVSAARGAAQQLHTNQLTPGLLRVCADPDNMPLSNQKGEGFEQKIAELIGKEWNTKIEYAWWPVRRGFFSRALNGRYCDVAIEAPAGLDMAGVTKPYFRSGYVFLTRKDSGLDITSLGRSAAQEAQDRRQSPALRCREHPACHGAEPLRRGRQPHRLQHLLHRRGPARGHHQGGGQEGNGHRDRLGAAWPGISPSGPRFRSCSRRSPSGTR